MLARSTFLENEGMMMNCASNQIPTQKQQQSHPVEEKLFFTSVVTLNCGDYHSHGDNGHWIKMMMMTR